MMTPRQIFIFCAFFSLSCVNAESNASDPGMVSIPTKRQNIPDFTPEEIREALKEGREKMEAWLGDRSAERVLAEEGPRLRARYAGASERERLVIGAMFSTLSQKLQESFPDPKAASSEGLLTPSKGTRLFLESSPGAANLDLLLLEGAALDTSAQMFLNVLYVHGHRQPEGDWLLPPHDPRIREFAGMLLGGFAGIEARPMVAVEWLERAASQGDVAAKRELGIIRVKGIEEVLEAEPARGVHLLTAAAEAGDADAQFRLGSLYFEGKDVQEDTEKAQALYRASAAQGFPEAMLYLGMRLWEGRGMAEDVKEASVWLKRCAGIQTSV